MTQACTLGQITLERPDAGATGSHSAGARGARQRLQIECTRRGEEHGPAELTEVLRGHEYPLHVIDFEAAQP